MKKKLHLTLVLICYCFTLVNVYAQNPVQVSIQQFESDPQLSGTSIGFCAIDARNGKIIAESKNNLNLAPASVLKLVTTSAALDILGPDYQFATTFGIATETKFGEKSENLIIKAGGDPTIASKYFFSEVSAAQLTRNWANSIAKQTQIKKFNKLILDLSIYDTQYIPNTWIWEDIGNYYGTGVYALSYFDNMCTLHFKSPAEANQATSITRVSPSFAEIELNNQVLSSSINKDNAYVFGSPFDNHRVVRGTIPKGRSDFAVKAALPSPPETLAHDLKTQLNSLGIKVEKIELHYQPVKISQILFEYKSPSLKQIVSVTNHESVNLFAEHLVKQIAYEKCGQGNFKVGLEEIKKYWAAKGISFSYLEDGSGLSRFNAITAEQLTQVIYSAYTNPRISAPFFNSLPIAPAGTLWYFNSDLFRNNSLRAKSGSMTRIRSFAGEIKTDKGNTILFSLITNNFPVNQSDLIKKIQTLLADIKRNY